MLPDQLQVGCSKDRHAVMTVQSFENDLSYLITFTSDGVNYRTLRHKNIVYRDMVTDIETNKSLC